MARAWSVSSSTAAAPSEIREDVPAVWIPRSITDARAANDARVVSLSP
jgi:hypothetical protein